MASVFPNRSAYMSATKGKMKPIPTHDRKPPPDLWMELKNMDKGGQDGNTTGRDKTGEDGSGTSVDCFDGFFFTISVFVQWLPTFYSDYGIMRTASILRKWKSHTMNVLPNN